VNPWPSTYAVFDIETDGLKTDTCIPTEVALIYVIDGQPVGSMCEMIWRSDDMPIPYHITKITGITLEMCQRQGKPIAQVFNMFWAYASVFPLVGHNIYKFDCPIVRRFMPPWAKADVYGADTTHLFRHYKRTGRIEWPPQKEMERMMNSAGRERFKYNLNVACQEMGVTRRDTHRAMEDTLDNMELYEAMRRRANVN